MMFRRSLLVISLAILSAPALAQTPTAPQSMQEALGQKLFSEINAGLTCGASLISVQKDLEVAKARIKELEAKTAPAEPAKQ